MKFNEAMEALKSGSKVTRAPWNKSCYFVLEGDAVKSYQPSVQHYPYDENIMISDGWEVSGVEGAFKFYEIIQALKMGSQARMSSWKPDTYIKYDEMQKCLVTHMMAEFPYAIDFASFLADDWMVVL